MANEAITILRTMGPTRIDTADGFLFEGGEPAGSTEFAESMRTPEMVTAGYGTLATTTTPGTLTTVAGAFTAGVTPLLPGGPTALNFDTDPSSPYKGSKISFGTLSAMRDAVDFDKSYTAIAFVRPAPFGEQESGTRESTIFSMYNSGGFRFTVRTDTAGATYAIGINMVCAGGTNVYAYSPQYDMDAFGGPTWMVAVTHEWDGTNHIFTWYAAALTSAALAVSTAEDFRFLSAKTHCTSTIWPTVIQQGALTCIGGETADVNLNYYNGILSVVSIQPRLLIPEVLNQIFQHAKVAAPTRVYQKNCEAMLASLESGNTWLRILGDSTGDVVGGRIPMRLSVDGIATRKAGYQDAGTSSIAGSAYASISFLADDSAPPGKWAVANGGPVVTKRGTGMIVGTGADGGTPDDAPDGTVMLSITNDLHSVPFTKMSCRWLYPKTAIDNAELVDDMVFRLADQGSNLVNSSPQTFGGSNVKFATLDQEVSGNRTGFILPSLRATSNVQLARNYAIYGCLIIDSTSVTNPQGVGTWGGIVSNKDGSTTGTHSNDSIYLWDELEDMDEALLQGISVVIVKKIVFVMLGINDVNGNVSAASMKTNYETIIGKAASKGYHVCLVQPWCCLGQSDPGSNFNRSDANYTPTRVAWAHMDEIWEDAILPLAVGNVSAISLHQRWRGIPYYLLEPGWSSPPVGFVPSEPAYATHPASNQAMAMLIPLGQALAEVFAHRGRVRRPSGDSGRLSRLSRVGA